MSQILLNNRYRIINTIASGGFGKVFLAQDQLLPECDRCVIKQLKPVAQDPKIQNLITERFQKEAEILASLGKNNSQIPKLYDYFTEAEQFYLVQEWIEGETLSNLIKFEGVFSENKVRNILISILSILDYIHSNKIIHRDIKPNNIILRFSDDLPVLIDFGAVKETMRTTIDPEGNLSSSIIVGTPGFMPSEQAIGRPVYSSDLYALGLVGIYLLTGKVPQDLETDPQTGEIVWHQYSSQISSSLVTTVDRAIRYHPRDRFSTAAQMLNALQSKETSVFLTLPPWESELTKEAFDRKITIAKSENFVPQKHSQKSLLGNLIKKGLLGSSLAFSTFLAPAPQTVVTPTAQISGISETVALPTVKTTPTPKATPISITQKSPTIPAVSTSTIPAIQSSPKTPPTLPAVSSNSTIKTTTNSKPASKLTSKTPLTVTKTSSNSTSKPTAKIPSTTSKIFSNSTNKTTTSSKAASKPTTKVSSNSTTKTTAKTPSTTPKIFSTSTSKTTSSTKAVSKSTTKASSNSTTKTTAKTPSTTPKIFRSSTSKTTSSKKNPSKPNTKAPSTSSRVYRPPQTVRQPTVRITTRTQTAPKPKAKITSSTSRKAISVRRDSKVEARKERREDRGKEMRKQTREERKKRD